MKKLMKLLVMSLLCLFVFAGCDNNEGPFSFRMENGKKVLYSGDKPAKGAVKNIEYFNNGTSVAVCIIDYDKGLPCGDFKLFDRTGKLIVDATGKWKDGNFVGKMKEPMVDGIAEGTFKLNMNYIMDYDGYFYYRSLAEQVLYDGKLKNNQGQLQLSNGKYDGKCIVLNPKTGKTQYETEYKKGVINGKVIEYYNNGNKHTVANMKNGIPDGEQVEYYPNGNKKLVFNAKNGAFNGKYTEYNKDGKKVYEKVYDNNVVVSEKSFQ